MRKRKQEWNQENDKLQRAKARKECVEAAINLVPGTITAEQMITGKDTALTLRDLGGIRTVGKEIREIHRVPVKSQQRDVKSSQTER